MEVNPTLLHVLKVDFDCDISPDEVLDHVDGATDEPWELYAAYDWLADRTRRVPALSIERRLVLTNFAYAKLSMVKDLENAFDELVAHDLIAAIAGDEEAQEAIRQQGPGPDAVPSVDATPLADEFLVLDADSSQNWAINAALSGASLIVRGPPGTGKSQTIANLIASLVARDKRVLFVAEKRAAIEAVIKRLNEKKLGHLLLDLHGGVGSRRAFAQRIGRALLAHRSAARVDRSVEQRRLESQRQELNDYVRLLHEERTPWGLSLYELRAELIGLRDHGDDFRLRGDELALDHQRYEELENAVREYARLGGFTLMASGSPWRKATIVSADEAQQAFAAVDELARHTLPTALRALQMAAEDTRLPEASTIDEWGETLALWNGVRETLNLYQATVFGPGIAELCERMHFAEEGSFTRFRASLFSSDYKTAREELRNHLNADRRLGDVELVRTAKAASAQAEDWRERGGQGTPRAPANEQLNELFVALREGLASVERLTNLDDLSSLPVDEARTLARALVEDRPTLVRLPELHRLENEFEGAGVESLIGELREAGASEERATKGLSR
jgi:hypothetical protein